MTLLHSIQQQEKANNNLHTLNERRSFTVTPVWKRFTRLSQQQLFTGGGQELPFVHSSSGQALQPKYRIMQTEKLPVKVAEWSKYSVSVHFIPAHVSRNCTADSQPHHHGYQRPAPRYHRAPAPAERPTCSAWCFTGYCPHEPIPSRNHSWGFSPQKPQPTLVWFLNRKHQCMEVWNTVILIHPYKFVAELVKCVWRTSTSQSNHVGSLSWERDPLPWIPRWDDVFYRRKWNVLYIINSI